jgi:hypothetical protein
MDNGEKSRDREGGRREKREFEAGELEYLLSVSPCFRNFARENGKKMYAELAK